jgi:hypothetical protein
METLMTDNKVCLNITNQEAELLHQALMTLIVASSPELLERRGWENAESVPAIALVQSVFDNQDIETLNQILCRLKISDFLECETKTTKSFLNDEDQNYFVCYQEDSTQNIFVKDSSKKSTLTKKLEIESSNIVKLSEHRKFQKKE